MTLINPYQKKLKAIGFFALWIGVVFLIVSDLNAAEPGVPFTEDFSNANLKDETNTNANWSTDEQEVYLAWRKQLYGAMSDPAVWDIGTNLDDTYATAFGDVDGDGDIDVIVGNGSYSQSNKLYLNNGSEIPFFLVSAVDIGLVAEQTQAIALGDMDGDGDLDVVTANANGPNKLYLNNGTVDPFSGGSVTNIGLDMTDDTFAIALGDVDGDGDLDVVAGNWGSNRLYLNNGTTTPFDGVSGTNIGSGSDNTRGIALGDMTGDGRLDIVVGNRYGVNELYLNNGTADPFSGVIGTDMGTDTNPTAVTALGDMNGDGYIDAVFGNTSGTNRLYLNNGTSDPFNGVSGGDIGTQGYSTYSIALGDMEGDGDLDVVTVNRNQTNRLYLNNGSSTPFNGVSGIEIGADADNTRSIALGDADGDGDLDLIAGNDGQKNRLYLNNSTVDPFNNISGTDIGLETEWTRAIALGDVDRDGDIDVVVGNHNQTNKLYLNNGTADPFNGISGTDIGVDTDYTRTIVLDDVNGDGDIDVVAGNGNYPTGETNKLYLNNGTVNPFNGVSGTDISSDTNSTEALVLGDVDGDGDIDVATGNAYQVNRLYLNNGSEVPFALVSGTDIGSGADYTWAIALGDVDNDGDLDVAVGDWGASDKLYLNNGTVNPFNNASATDIGGGYSVTTALLLEDMDGDGNLDVVSGNRTQATQLYLNNGTIEPFNGVSGTDIGLDTDTNTYAIAVADVDADGDLDVMEGNYQQSNKLYLNNGTSNPFTGVTGTDISSDTGSTYAITFGDMDRDGDIDVVTGDYGQTNRLYLNTGLVDPFTGASGADIGTDTETLAIALGDVDKDGDLDVVTGDHGDTNKLYLNNGTIKPFDGVGGTDIGVEVDNTYAIALGDMDKDGSLDVLVGNYFQPNRLYLNNGTSAPYTGVSGLNISSDNDSTKGIALGDVDGDGDIDVVAGNYSQANKLYLNNGTANPFSSVNGRNIGADLDDTNAIVIGDIDGDGDLDSVVGNSTQTKKLYLNNGTLDPFNGISGTDIGADTDITVTIVLGDVDNDGDLDVLAGNSNQTNKLYLNNRAANPFIGVVGTNVGPDADKTFAIELGDVNKDGTLDVVAGNNNQTNKLYLNNGTDNPFNGVNAVEIGTDDTEPTYAIALEDINTDGYIDVVVGDFDRPNKAYHRTLSFNTGQGLTTSIEIDTESINNISNATLTYLETTPANTGADYFLSNNGGKQFYQVYQGQEFSFPTTGNYLRWRVQLYSLSPALTPRIQELTITTRNIAPEATAGDMLVYIEDGPATPIDQTITIKDIDNVNLEDATVRISGNYISGEDVLAFTNTNDITGEWDTETGTLILSGPDSVENYQAALRSVTYENINNGKPSTDDRTIEFSVSDGELSSFPVVSTITITSTNDAPVISSYTPTPATMEQYQILEIKIGSGSDPGVLYVSVFDPDTPSENLSLSVQGGDNYYIQGNTIIPVGDYFGPIDVPVLVYDGIDYSDIATTPKIDIQVNDVSSPIVTGINSPDDDPTNASSVTFEVLFNEAVTGVTPDDFSLMRTGSLSGGTVDQVTGSGSIYSVTVGGYSGDGDLRLDLIDDGSIYDISVNPLGGPGPGNGNFTSGMLCPIDREAPTVLSIMRTDPNPTNATSVDFTVIFSEAVQGVDPTDFDLTQTVTNGAVQSVNGSGSSYVVTVDSYSGAGNLRLDLTDNNSILDMAGTGNPLGGTGVGDGSFTTGEVYDIDVRSASGITCTLSASGLILGEPLTITGQITPPPAQAGAFVSISLIPPGGGEALTSVTANAAGEFSYDTSCMDIDQAGAWTVRASWNGDDGLKPAMSTDQPLDVEKAGSRVTLDATSQAIKLGDTVSLSGKFTPNPNCGGDLTGLPLTLFITGPNGTDVQEVTTNDPFGHFVLPDYDRFDVLGDWTVQVYFFGNSAYVSSISAIVPIRVVETAGYAIVVQGKIASEEGLASHNKTTNFVYEKLKDRGLLDEDIQYFNYDTGQAGVDGLPAESAIASAITDWAKDKMNARPANLYLIMVDHGLEEEFYIDPDVITSAELDGWLTTLQAGLEAQAADQEIIVMLGFCRAGSFIDELSGPHRVVIASAAAGESSYKGPLDEDGVREGEYFVSEFFKQVAFGKSVKQCFEEATVLTEAFTSSGTGLSSNSPYYDDSYQHPLLDDNGDGTGSNSLADPSGDGVFSDDLFIGVSSITGNDPGDVRVTSWAAPQHLATTDTSADLWATVDDDARLRTIWVEVKPPGYSPIDPGGSGQAEMDLVKTIGLWNAGTQRYEWNALAGFTDPGTYQVFYFAKDDITGNVSPLVQTTVYKAKAGNQPPDAFSLQSPDDQAEVGTEAILLDWTDTTDPEGDAFTFTVLLSKDDAAFTSPIVKASLANSAVVISRGTDGIEDLSHYYWKVQAIDAYGAITESAVREFTTNFINVIPGWIEGHVYSAADGSAVTNATVTIGASVLPTGANGYYLYLKNPGIYSTLVTATGFENKTLDITILEAGLVIKDIYLEPSVAPGDIDLDGSVTLTDALLALQVIVGLEPANSHVDGDINGDGRIGIAEFIFILQEIAGLRD